MTSRVRGWGTTMRTLLYIIAILLIAAGMAVGLGSFYAPGQVVIGLNLESASILLTGGFVMLGLATVTAALLTVAEVLAGTRSAPSSGAGAGAGPGGAVAATGPAPDKSWPGNYGRRKGRVNLKTDLRNELSERIHIREGERSLKVSKQRAMLKAMVVVSSRTPKLSNGWRKSAIR